MKRLYFLSFFVAISIAGASQPNIPTKLQSKLREMGVDILLPLDSDYKAFRPAENDYIRFDWAIRSRKDKMEIYYAFEPYRAEHAAADLPHLKFGRLLMTLATNDDPGIMTVHQLDASDLKEKFGADWGKVAYFQPKKNWAARQHCKMLTLFREGQGTAYVLFLFDDPQDALEKRNQAIYFQ